MSAKFQVIKKIVKPLLKEEKKKKEFVLSPASYAVRLSKLQQYTNIG